MISANLIIDSVNNFTELNLTNPPNSQINPSYILPFLPKTIEKKILDLDDAHKIFIEYNEDFKKKLERYVKLISTKILNTGYTEEIKVSDIINESLRLFNDALEKGLNSNSLRQFRYVRFISICLVYYSLISLGITSLGHGSISVRDITDIKAEDYKDLGFGSHKSLRFGCGLLKEYVDQDIINKIKNMPATQGIVFNSVYFDRLETYLNFIGKKAINYYNLSIELDDLVSRAIKIFNDCIFYGLEPSDMGINKSESFMSIILIYYSLISFKILKLKSERITITKIVYDLLFKDYVQIGFSSFCFSTHLSAGSLYAYLPKYVKDFVNILPERDFSKLKGKYESICKRAFDEFFSNVFSKKVQFIPHLELFKLVNKQYNGYLENHIRRAHIDGALRINLPKDRIRQLKHNLKTNVKIPKTIIEQIYIIKDLNDSNINDLKDKIKDDYLKDKPKLIKIQFPIGYIKILLKNSKIYLLERYIDIPFTYSNSNVVWIVFEYNGLQHYIFPNYYQKDFNQIDRFLDRLIQDLLKFYLFNDNGAVTFEFPYWIDNKMSNQTKINDYLKTRVKSFFIY
ncbi:MAG: hypothetical protein ACFFHD_16060 [Promethearchaeota archaeon]